MKCCLYLLLFLFSSGLLSQDISGIKGLISNDKYESLLNQIDSANSNVNALERVGQLTDLARDINRISGENAIKLFDHSLEEAKIIGHDSMIAFINMAGSVPRINASKFDQARKMLDNSKLYWEASKDTLNLAKAYTLIGYLERLEGSNFLAIKNLYRAKELEEKIIPTYEMWDVYNRLIINYKAINDLEAAAAVGEEFLISAKEQDPKPRGYFLIMRNTSEVYLELGNIEKARPYIKEVTPKWIDNDYSQYKAYGYFLIYDLAIADKNLITANTYADSAVHYSYAAESPLLQSDAHFRKYEVLQLIGETTKLDFHISTALEKALLSKNKSSILKMAKEASAFEASIGNYKKAHQLQFLADSLRTQIYSDEMVNDLRKFEKQFIQKQSQIEIDLLNSQNILKAQNLKKANRLRSLLIGLLILAFGTICLIYLLLHQRSRNNNKLEEKNLVISNALSEKETLLREIHHRVKNNLQFISSLLGLQTEHIKDEAALDALQEGQDRVQSMALIHQNLYQEDNLTGVDVQDYFVKLIQGLFDSYNVREDKIKLLLAIQDINLDVDTVIPIGLIVNELISNSLKYAFLQKAKGNISVQLKEVKETLCLTVSDDGIGMTYEQIKDLGSSFGYRLIQAFTSQLQGKIAIKGTQGTSVELSFSKYEIVE